MKIGGAFTVIFIIILTFSSCRNISAHKTASQKSEIKKNISSTKVITLKDRAGYYKSTSPYFTFNIDLKQNGYAYVILKGWMVYKGTVKIGNPNSEDKKFRLDIDNITYVILEFKDLNNAKASVVLKGVVQQVLNMNKT